MTVSVVYHPFFPTLLLLASVPSDNLERAYVIKLFALQIFPLVLQTIAPGRLSLVRKIIGINALFR